MMLIQPDGDGGWTVISYGEVEGWIRKDGDEFEFAHVNDEKIGFGRDIASRTSEISSLKITEGLKL